MFLTKKHYAIIALALTAILFVVFLLYLPVEVGGHRPGNVPLLLVNVGFLAITAAIVLVLGLVVLTRRDYIKSQLATLQRFRYLLFLMVKRDFVTRYRRSVLGIVWSVLNPLLTMLVMTMVFSMIFRWDIANFPVYLLSGQLIFNFFSESTNRAMTSIVESAPTIKKVYVPKYIFPVSRVASSMINVIFIFVAFMIVFVVTGAPFHWTLLLFPIPILYTFVFSLGMGLLLSSMAVFFRDLTYIYGVGLTLWMFLTPIMYPVSILPDRVYHLIHLNPMFHFVNYFRDLALNGVVPGLWPNIICLGFALAALCAGLFAMTTQQDKYILYV